MTTAELAPPRARSRGLALVRAFRPHQWVKNLLVFVPVVLDHKLFQPDTMARAATAFFAFCGLPQARPTRSLAVSAMLAMRAIR